MAKKISELAAAAALDGTESIPVVQSGSTKKTTGADVGTYLLADGTFTTGIAAISLFATASILDTDLTSGGEDDNHVPSALAVTTYAAPKASPTFTGTVTGRIGPRVSSEASSATPTINTDNVDAHSITALATAITSMTSNLSGTPTNFQKLVIRIKDDGTGRAITWGASFESVGATLPTTTTAGKRTTVGLIYDSVAAKWGCVAAVTEA